MTRGRTAVWLPCGLAALAAAAEPSHRPSPCTSKGAYDTWLSAPEAFVRTDQPKGLQGLYIGCLWRGEAGGILLETFRDAVRWPGGPDLVELQAQAETSWPSFRVVVAEVLNMNAPTSTWPHQEMKQPYGMFASDTSRLASVQDALAAELIFIVRGGQWFWPPVQEGFVRHLPGQGIALQTLSVQPVVYQVRGFLKENECDELVEMGKGRMVESPVTLMDKDKGKAAKEFRTSTQARIDRSESQVLRDIDARIGMLTGVPKGHNEELQLLRYSKTQYYSAHLDNWDPRYYSDSAWFEHGHENRFITVFWYLTNVEKGGETIFPRSNGLPQPMDMFSCEHGLKVKPVKGSVIFWYSLLPNGNTDPNGLHGACPVEEGQKFSANYWVWNKPRVPNPGVYFAERDPRLEDEGNVGQSSFGNDSGGTSHFFSSTALLMTLAAVAGILGLVRRRCGRNSGGKEN